MKDIPTHVLKPKDAKEDSQCPYDLHTEEANAWLEVFYRTHGSGAPDDLCNLCGLQPLEGMDDACVSCQLEIEETEEKKEIKQGNIDPKGAAGALKVPMQYLPLKALGPVAEVMKLGAKKYGAKNWLWHDGVGLHTYKGAILRHLALIDEGQDVDDESGQLHLAHIAASCLILIDAIDKGKMIDTRVESDPKAVSVTKEDKQPVPFNPATTIITNPRYWDCNCENYYIQEKLHTTHCTLCACDEDDCSDSRIDEVDEGSQFADLRPLTDLES